VNPRSDKRQFVRDHGLTLALLCLCMASLLGHAITGWHVWNEDRSEHGEPPKDWIAYLGSGAFHESVAENWESEFLQMLCFVWFATFLYERGSPESKTPGEEDPSDADPRAQPIPANAPWPVKKGGLVLKLYEHSLAIAFLSLFLGSFVWHIFGGLAFHNEERARLGEPPLTATEYAASSDFWFESFQNWQSEFLSVAAMVFLSVYLRQRGSPESKPVATPHLEHGE
jgi:hypothetical protein